MCAYAHTQHTCVYTVCIQPWKPAVERTHFTSLPQPSQGGARGWVPGGSWEPVWSWKLPLTGLKVPLGALSHLLLPPGRDHHPGNAGSRLHLLPTGPGQQDDQVPAILPANVVLSWHILSFMLSSKSTAVPCLDHLSSFSLSSLNPFLHPFSLSYCLVAPFLAWARHPFSPIHF